MGKTQPVTKVADALKARGVTRVAHAHADHFEPFGHRAAGLIGLDDVKAWVEVTSGSERGRKASLFYRQMSHCPTSHAGNQMALWQDARFALVRDSLYAQDGEILDLLWHHQRPLEVHVHHESLTGCTTSGFASEAEDYARLDAFVKLNLWTLRGRGFPMSTWSFVHGCWALQASDKDVCNVTDEVRLLVENGAVADFSFPAGRSWCNPTTIRTPYTVLPVDGRKAYDTSASQPQALTGPGARAIAPGRFLVWSCPQPYEDVSIDRLTTHPRDGATVALDWATKGWVYGDTLWVKTHAHSLAPNYWPDTATGRKQTPLVSPGVTAVFDALYRACDAAGVAMSHVTIGELLDELQAQDGGRFHE